MRNYAESTEQQCVFAVAGRTPYAGGTVKDFVYAIPNAGSVGGKRGLRAGARRKAEGVTAGVPDIECMVAVAPYTGLHIELKLKDGVPSDVSKAQREMIERLRSCGRKCEVAYGWESAWEILRNYLGVK